jgi:hypothetical protein
MPMRYLLGILISLAACNAPAQDSGSTAGNLGAAAGNGSPGQFKQACLEGDRCADGLTCYTDTEGCYVDSTRVTGTLTGNDGSRFEAVLILRTPDDDTDLRADHTSFGSFEFLNVPPGIYAIHVNYGANLTFTGDPFFVGDDQSGERKQDISVPPP